MKLDARHVVRTGLLWFLSAISRVSDHDKSSLRQAQPIHSCLDDVVLLRVGLLFLCDVVPGPVFRVKAEAAGGLSRVGPENIKLPKGGPQIQALLTRGFDPAKAVETWQSDDQRIVDLLKPPGQSTACSHSALQSGLCAGLDDSTRRVHLI